MSEFFFVNKCFTGTDCKWQTDPLFKALKCKVLTSFLGFSWFYGLAIMMTFLGSWTMRLLLGLFGFIGLWLSGPNHFFLFSSTLARFEIWTVPALLREKWIFAVCKGIRLQKEVRIGLLYEPWKQSKEWTVNSAVSPFSNFFTF